VTELDFSGIDSLPFFKEAAKDEEFALKEFKESFGNQTRIWTFGSKMFKEKELFRLLELFHSDTLETHLTEGEFSQEDFVDLLKKKCTLLRSLTASFVSEGVGTRKKHEFPDQ
jgi:hypothetical protein